jgi:Cof subfamily protein (haloacid dehalogenase superfamily)
MNLPEFNSLPRAIAIDLDGTLLTSKTQLSERSHEVVERCISHGIPVVIATSRPARIFQRIFPQDLRKKCSYVLMNGAIARGSPPLDGYYKETLPADIMKGVIDTAKRSDPDVRITIEIDGFEFGTNWQWDPAVLWQRNSATPDMVLTLEESLKRQCCKIALGNTDINKLAAILTQEFGQSVSIVSAKLVGSMVYVTSLQATKQEALCRLLSPKGIKLEEVIAFGDDFPDLDMLKACGIAVAMANAFPEVKAVCKYETTSNDEDGVALVLEKMLRLL